MARTQVGSKTTFIFCLTRVSRSPRIPMPRRARVLMTNHVHLLLTPTREDSANLPMKHLGQRYVQYINRTY